MLHYFHEAVDRIGGALELLADSVVQVDIGWVIVGTVLSVLAQIVRVRGWHTIIRAAYPEADELRQRDTAQAYLAGAGLNGVIPARGGDVVKLALVHRRVPESSYATLAATFVPETVFETLFGTGLVIWALSQGFLPVPTAPGELPSLDVTFVLQHPVLS
ncbi:MAG TPA: lysylphosphatidylglycerol synthase domain-containing protein, partial [Solirubrobacteraceae bacterium]